MRGLTRGRRVLLLLVACALVIPAGAAVPAPMDLTLSGPGLVVAGVPMTFSGRLVTALLVGVPSAPIELWIDGAHVGSATTTPRGDYSMVITAPSAGVHVAYASYESHSLETESRRVEFTSVTTPPAPVTVGVEQVPEANLARISWTLPGGPHGPTTFLVYGAQGDEPLALIGETSEASYVTRVTRATMHRFAVAAENMAGTGPQSEPVTFTSASTPIPTYLDTSLIDLTVCEGWGGPCHYVNSGDRVVVSTYSGTIVATARGQLLRDGAPVASYFVDGSYTWWLDYPTCPPNDPCVTIHDQNGGFRYVVKDGERNFSAQTDTEGMYTAQIEARYTGIAALGQCQNVALEVTTRHGMLSASEDITLKICRF